MLNAESGRARRIALGLGGGLVVLCVLLALRIWRRPEPEPPVAASRETVEIARPSPAPEASQPAATVKKKAGQSIRGTVWYDRKHRKPAAGVSVTARNCRPPINKTAAVTDAEGVFVLQAYVPEASYALLAEDKATGHVSVDCPVVEVKRGESVENVDLVIEKGGSISGRVLGVRIKYSQSRLAVLAGFLDRRAVQRQKEQPLPGLEVTLKGSGFFPFERTMATDAKGRYSFEDLPPGTYEIDSKRPADAIVVDRQTRQSAKLMYPGTMRIKNIDIRFRVDGMSITGHVSNTLGQPLAGAEIAVDTIWAGESGPAGDTLAGTTTTSCDDMGNYRMDRLRAMSLEGAQGFMSWGQGNVKYYVRARMKDYAAGEIAVPALNEDLIQTIVAIRKATFGLGQGKSLRPGKLPQVRGRVISGIDFVLDKAATVSGTFVDRHGNALAKRMVYLQPSTAGSSSEFEFYTMHSVHDYLGKLTDDLGQFSFEGLAADTYTFCTYGPPTAGVDNRLDADNQPLTLSAGDTVRDYVVTIEGGEER